MEQEDKERNGVIILNSREQYYKYISEKKLSDILSLILELSYSQKLKILQSLETEYDTTIINQALVYFQKKYIDIHRVNFNCIDKTLLCLCRVIKEKGRL